MVLESSFSHERMQGQAHVVLVLLSLLFVMQFACLGQLTLRSILPAVHEGVRQHDIFDTLS